MVGGKEVQLVTPNVGARRPTNRVNSGSVRPIHGQPIGPGQIQVSRTTSSSAPGDRDNQHHGHQNHSRYPGGGGLFRAPMGVPIRPPVHQQPHKPAVNLRKAVGGADKPPPPPPPQQKSSLIKLNKSRDNETKSRDTNTNSPGPDAKSNNTNDISNSVDTVVNEEEVSTRQLAENWLHTGASRKFGKKEKTGNKTSQLPTTVMTKATEKILDLNNKIPLKTANHKIEKKSKGYLK